MTEEEFDEARARHSAGERSLAEADAERAAPEEGQAAPSAESGERGGPAYRSYNEVLDLPAPYLSSADDQMPPY